MADSDQIRRASNRIAPESEMVSSISVNLHLGTTPKN